MPGDEEIKQPDEGQNPEAGAEGVPTDSADALDADSPGAEGAVEAASASAAEVARQAADPKTPVSNAADDAALAALKAAQQAIASVKSGTFTSDADGEPARRPEPAAAKPAAPSNTTSSNNPAPSGGARAAQPFTPIEVSPAAARPVPAEVDLLADVNLNVKIELGRTRMFVEDVLKLGEGSVVELDKAAGDPVDVYVNDRRVARGEVLVINDCFCVRVSEILTAASAQD